MYQKPITTITNNRYNILYSLLIGRFSDESVGSGAGISCPGGGAGCALGGDFRSEEGGRIVSTA
jgi:hypothetical protein